GESCFLASAEPRRRVRRDGAEYVDLVEIEHLGHRRADGEFLAGRDLKLAEPPANRGPDLEILELDVQRLQFLRKRFLAGDYAAAPRLRLLAGEECLVELDLRHKVKCAGRRILA